MTRNLRAFRSAFAIVTVASAMMASGAQAAAGEFHIFGSPTVVKGETTESRFSVLGGLIVKCGNSALEGQPAAKTTFDLTLTPTIEGCKVGGSEMEVRMNGCKYKLTGTAELTAKFGIVGCTAGKQLEVKLSFCTLSFPEQGGLSHVVFENKNPGAGKEDEESTKDLEASFTVSGMHYTESSGVFCGTPGKEHTDGSFTAKMTMRAYLATNSKEVTKQEHKYLEVVAGAQVGMLMT